MLQDPANHNNLTHCFLALNVELTKDISLDKSDQIRVELKPLNEVIRSLKNSNPNINPKLIPIANPEWADFLLLFSDIFSSFLAI